jgi:nodulation protein E
MTNGRRVAITGMGAVTANGIGVEALWTAVRDGKSAVGPIQRAGFERARIRHAATIEGFDPLAYVTPQVNTTLDRFSSLAAAAADEALGAAGIRPGELDETCAVVIGSGIGGSETIDRASRVYYREEEARGDPMVVPKIMPNAAASQISMRYGARGPTFCVSSACASSTQAVGMGAQMVRAGMVKRAVVGGSEAMVNPSFMRAWEVLRVLSPTLNRPFSRGRDGMVLGEGAAILFLEDMDDALARGATILAEVAGYGTSSDANDLLKPDPVGAARAMQMAIEDAGMDTSGIGYVNAHGTGTVLNDLSETEALSRIFGNRLPSVPVSSTKPVHGHTIGAAGAVELIVTVKALLEQVVPPTINWAGPDPKCELDAVPNTARKATFTAAMSNSFAFGGFNAAVVVKAVAARA